METTWSSHKQEHSTFKLSSGISLSDKMKSSLSREGLGIVLMWWVGVREAIFVSCTKAIFNSPNLDQLDLALWPTQEISRSLLPNSPARFRTGLRVVRKKTGRSLRSSQASYFRVRRIIPRLISLLGMGRTIRTSMILEDLVLLEVYFMIIQIPVSSPSLPHLRTVSQGLRCVISRFSRRGGW